MPSKKPAKSPQKASQANSEIPTRRPVPETKLEAAHDDLIKLFFQKERNHWINGIAIGDSLEAIEANKQAAIEKASIQPVAKNISPSKPIAQRLLVFVNPSAPDCERKAIQAKCDKTGQPFTLFDTSRFVALAQSGDSISPLDQSRYNVSPFSAGTLGCFVEAGGKTHILGSNHVIAHNGRVPPGANIVAPGLLEDLMGGPILGSRSDFIALLPQLPPNISPVGTPGNDNFVDCALAEVPANVLPPNRVQIDPLPKTLTNTLGPTTVRKHGRTTLNTSATVTMYKWNGPIDFTFGTHDFKEMLGCEVGHDIFAAPGDSGALAFVDDPAAPASINGKGVGLVTARAYKFDTTTKQFVSYIILLCSLDSIADAFAAQLSLSRNNLKFSI